MGALTLDMGFAVVSAISVSSILIGVDCSQSAVSPQLGVPRRAPKAPRHAWAELFRQVWPHPEVGALPAGRPGHVPGHAEAALHERTGAHRQVVRGVPPGAALRGWGAQTAAAVVRPAVTGQKLHVTKTRHPTCPPPSSPRVPLPLDPIFFFFLNTQTLETLRWRSYHVGGLAKQRCASLNSEPKLSICNTDMQEDPFLPLFCPTFFFFKTIHQNLGNI